MSPVNNITFPRGLRDAIPDQELCFGRVLKLDAVDAQCANTHEWGPSVQLKLQVCETGKLEGKFDVWLDMEAPAAKALAEMLALRAAQAEKIPPVHAFGRPVIKRAAIVRKRK